MPDEPEASQTGLEADRLLVARLIRPHGRRGELVAEILTDFPERFHQRPRLILVPPEGAEAVSREMDLENFWFLRSRIILKFRGVNSINDAEGLRSYGVAILAADRAQLEAGEVYVSDLVGCQVADLNAGTASIGEVVDVDRGSSSAELLVVRRLGSDEELLIPFVKDYLVAMEPEKREILMRLPEGLLEINAPMTDEEKARQAAQGERKSSDPPAKRRHKTRGRPARGRRTSR